MKTTEKTESGSLTRCVVGEQWTVVTNRNREDSTGYKEKNISLQGQLALGQDAQQDHGFSSFGGL